LPDTVDRFSHQSDLDDGGFALAGTGRRQSE
jgi:hypothetical protein